MRLRGISLYPATFGSGRRNIFNSCYLDLAEMAFRVQLLAHEDELEGLRGTVKSLHTQKSSRDKAVKEIHRLKEIISSQDEQVKWRLHCTE